VIALCGRDRSLIHKLQALKPASETVGLECCEYVNDMPARLRRASVLVARPSASLFLESILAGVPMLIPAKATKNDSGTVDLTRAWRIGETYDDDDEIPATLTRMLSNLGEYRARLQDLRMRYPEPRADVETRIRSVVWRAVC
jgi:UDP-N-acetylglucosamine:LPS N-acetylglucosamine transferase